MRIIKCMCSRCKLYLRASSEQGDQDYAALVELKTICFEDRKYQTALIEYAKNHNIMGCLPTGSGKTFIALKLIEHYKGEVMSGKKVFFLANTIPLVNQQAAFISRNSNFKVRFLTGDCDVDYWSKDKWDAVIQEFNVMAMTSQIFLNMINHGHIKFSDIVLLVFDECHHAVNEHPMANIMKAYKSIKSRDPHNILPRILGLTATIIKGTCKPHQVPEKVMELESTMDSVALTYKDYEEVLKHSTSAKVEPLMFTNSIDMSVSQSLISELEAASKSLQKFRNERKKAKMGVSKIIPSALDPNLTTFDNVYNLMAKKPSPGDLKVALDDVLHAYRDLGLYCTMIAINLRLAFIEFSLMDINDGEVKSWYHKIKDYLKRFSKEIQGIMDRVPEKMRTTEFISEKLKSLVGVLEKYREFESDPVCDFGTDDRHLCGLVFTDRRTTAQVLAWYLKDLAANNEKKHGFIKANFVVGTSRSAFESIESRVYARKQTETLNRFRRKECNLLVATSVLEEGIDVPSCNVVIRFDPVTTYTSYIQSMGRARKKGADFIALLPSNDYLKNVERLSTFREINRRIIAHLQTNVEKIDAGEHTLPFSYAPDLIPPICPGGTAESPRITMDSVVDVVERYCNLLPCDGISTLQSMSWWTTFSPGLYQGTLKMPLNSVVKGSIVGIPLKDKGLAKQAVYMAAAQKMLEAGVFDEQLIPVHQTFSLAVEKFFSGLVPTLNEGNEPADIEIEEGEVIENQTVPDATSTDVEGPSSAKKLKTSQPEIPVIRREWIKKREPSVLNGCPLTSKSPIYAYRIIFDLTKPRELYPCKNLHQLKDALYGLGLICSQMIPDFASLPLFGAFGTMTCSLERIKISPRHIRFSELEEVQDRLFMDILGIKNPLLKGDRSYGYMVVPLVKAKEWQIDDSIKDKLTELESIQKSRPPQRPRDQSINRNPAPKLNLRKFDGAIVFPWYKGQGKKPAYLVNSIERDMSPLTKFHDGFHPNYKKFVESQYPRVRIQDVNQPLLKCKLAGIEIGRIEKDPIQLNYLLEKYAKEDEYPTYLVPELCYSVSLPAKWIVQLKLLPSFLHRMSRILLSRELLVECGKSVDYPILGSEKMDTDEMVLLESTQNYKKEQEEVRRKERLRLRNAKLRNLPKSPNPNVPHMEERELHYEFIHPNEITEKDIRIFHEAVSSHHSAKKLTLKSAEVEVISAELSLPSTFELMELGELDNLIDPIYKDIEQYTCPSLLSVMESLSTRFSNEGLSVERLRCMGTSFMSFTVSLFAYHNFPQWGEPLMCQFRNRLLSLQVLYAVGNKMKIGEWLSGSDFNPGASWTPPGKKVPELLGEVAVNNKFHLSIFEEIAADRITPVQTRSREELEKFAEAKSKSDPNEVPLFASNRLYSWKKNSDVEQSNKPSSSTSTGVGNPSTSMPSTSASRSRSSSVTSLTSKPQKGKKKFSRVIKHATFTHNELADFDIANGLCGVVGAFFSHGGPAAGYKALKWLDFKAPGECGTGKFVDDLQPLQISGFSGPSFLYEQLAFVEKEIQYEFKEKSLLLQAFTHPSYPAHNFTECYQRLEFLGDSILDLLLTNHVYSLSGFKPEELRSIRNALVNSVTYASLAVRYQFNKYLLSMSKSLTDMIDNFVVYQESLEHNVTGHFKLISDEECFGPKHIEVPKVLADIWEALAGAVYIDSGGSLDSVWKVFYRLMQHEIDLFSEKKFMDENKPPIDDLKAFAEKEGIELQFNRNTGKKTLARGREIVKVSVGRWGYYYGVGTNKQRARDAAAKIALKLIKEEDTFTKNRDDKKPILLMC